MPNVGEQSTVQPVNPENTLESIQVPKAWVLFNAVDVSSPSMHATNEASHSCKILKT